MFRFTIRDVLWLTVVVGLTLGWFVDRAHWKTEQRTFERRIDRQISLTAERERDLQGHLQSMRASYADLERCLGDAERKIEAEQHTRNRIFRFEVNRQLSQPR